MKKILILGATGFIGRNAALYFAKKSDFLVFGTYFNSDPFEHEKVKMLHVDLTKKKDVDKVIKGMDIQRVGQAAANIRAYRKPEPYKGKGVKYTDEVIVRKEAKKS